MTSCITEFVAYLLVFLLYQLICWKSFRKTWILTLSFAFFDLIKSFIQKLFLNPFSEFIKFIVVINSDSYPVSMNKSCREILE